MKRFFYIMLAILALLPAGMPACAGSAAEVLPVETGGLYEAAPENMQPDPEGGVQAELQPEGEAAPAAEDVSAQAGGEQDVQMPAPGEAPSAEPEAQEPSVFRFSQDEITIGYKETVSGALSVETGPDYAGGITYASSDKKIVRVDAHTGEIYGAKRGTAVITATGADGLTAQCSVKVAKAPDRITLSADCKTIGVGESLDLKVGFNSGAHSHNVKITSDAPEVLRIEGSQAVALSPGKAKVSVRSHNGEKASLTLTVKEAPAEITFADVPAVLGVGQEARLDARLNSGAAGRIAFSGDAPEIAQVDAGGRILPLNPGMVNVYAESYNGVRTCRQLEIVPAPGKMWLSADAVEIGVKEKIAAPVQVYTDTGAAGGFSYSSSNKRYVTVDAETGEITGARKGSAVITVTAYNGLSASYKVSVRSAPDEIELSGPKTMGVGQCAALAVQGEDGAYVGMYNLSSSDEAVVRINPETGMAEAVGAGRARITAVNYNKRKDALNITVLPAPEAVAFERERYVLGAGQELQLHASVNEGACGSLRFYGESEYGGVSETGMARAFAPGSFAATVEAHNGVFAVCEVQVLPAPEQVLLSVDALNIGVGEKLEGAIQVSFNEGSMGGYTYASSNAKVLKVDDKTGRLTGVRAGMADLTVTAHNGVSAVCRVTVMKAPSRITLTLPAKTMGVGQTMQPAVKLSSKSCGAWTISSSDEDVIAVEADGTLRAVGKGTARITARTYNGKKSSVRVQVVAAPTQIVPAEACVVLNQDFSRTLEFQLNKGGYADLTYASSDPAVASVDAQGRVTGISAGYAEITATTHNGLSALVQVEVLPAPEEIRFAENPLVIGAGEQHVLLPILLPDRAESSFQFESSDPEVVSAGTGGVLTGLKKGGATITVTACNGVQAKLAVEVTDYYRTNPVTVIAHRGASGYAPDNTLQAIRHAVELGASEIEIDVRKTSDGVLVLHHDANILIDGEEKPIRKLSLRKLRTVKPDVCTLEEALACLAGTDVKVLIEFKVSGIEKDVLDCVQESGMADSASYASFHLSVLGKIHRLNKDARTVYLINDKADLKDVTDEPGDYKSDTVSVKLSLLNEKTVRKLHLAGKRVIAWTVNSLEDIQAAREMGVDGITTDYPDRV